jgi:hypothetical protein
MRLARRDAKWLLKQTIGILFLRDFVNQNKTVCETCRTSASLVALVNHWLLQPCSQRIGKSTTRQSRLNPIELALLKWRGSFTSKDSSGSGLST